MRIYCNPQLCTVFWIPHHRSVLSNFWLIDLIICRTHGRDWVKYLKARLVRHRLDWNTKPSMEEDAIIHNNLFFVLFFSQYQYHLERPIQEMTTQQSFNWIVPQSSLMGSGVTWTVFNSPGEVTTSELLEQSLIKSMLKLLTIVTRWHNSGWKRLRKKGRESGANIYSVIIALDIMLNIEGLAS